MPAAAALLIVVSMLVAAPASAGSLFGNPEIEVGGSVYGLDTADLNGDGVEDFVVGLRATTPGVGSGGTNHEILVVLSDGDGHAASRTFYTSGEQPRHVTIGNVDGDGDLDLIVSNFTDGTVTLLTNNGGGTFVDALSGATVLAAGSGPLQSLFVNVVGDALPDIVVSTSGTTSVFRNLGGGAFAPAAVIGDGGFLGEIQAADLEPDGDVDVVSIGGFLLRNNGDGTFTRVDVAPDMWRSIALGDVDSDGDPDLVAGTSTNQVAVYPNAAGSFGTPTLYSGPGGGLRASALALGDLEADGDLDIAAANRSEGDETIFLLRNDGSGSFGPAEEHRVDNQPDAMHWGHYDTDPHLDLAVACGVVGGSGTLIVLLGDGAGDLGDPRTQALGGLAYGLDVGDVDGDGDPDVVAAMRDVSGVAVLVNDGAGGLPVAGYFDVSVAFVGGLTDELELVDFDDDDDLDLAISAHRGYGAVVALNNGAGNFTPAQELEGLAIGIPNLEPRDVDGDGDPDFVAAARTISGVSEISIYLNDGAGHFPSLPMVVDTTSGFAEDLALEDIDGDGDPDAVTPYYNGEIRIRRNNGSGVFGPPTVLTTPAGLRPDDVTLADLDGDMRPELIVGASSVSGSSGPIPFADRVLIFPNDGAGNFGTAQSIATGVGPEHFAVADFDLDGDPDVAVANTGYLDAQRGRSGNITLLLNDGAGTITRAGSFELGTFPGDNDYGERLQPIDFDRDGDVDLVYADPESSDLLIFVNRLVGTERVAASGVLPGSYATSDGEADGASPLDPVETIIVTPVGGDVEILEGAISSAPPAGWMYFGQEIAITADSSTALTPLLIGFRVDASLIPAGHSPVSLRMFRAGTIVPRCSAAGSEAAPDPCLQAFTVEVDGDVTLEVRSSAASAWNFGVQLPMDLGIDFSLLSPLGTELISFTLDPWHVDLILEGLGDFNNNNREQLPGIPPSFQAVGQSANWGEIRLRLRDPQAAPFQLSTMDVEESANAIPGQLELPPYTGQGSGVATLTAYIELEIPQQQILLHSTSAFSFAGAITRWPPAPGEKLESSLQLDLFDEQNQQTGFVAFLATATPSTPPAPPSGTVPPPPPPSIPVPALGPWALLACGWLLLASGMWLAARRRRIAIR